MPAKPKYDWEAIEKEYRTGQLSNVALAEKYGPTEGAIRHRAKNNNWQKDLVDDYQKGVENQLIHDNYEGDYEGRSFKTASEIASDKEIVDQAVQVGVEVVRNHRKRLRELNAISDKLTAKLKAAVDEDPDSDGNLPSLIGFKSYHDSVYDLLSKLAGINTNTIKLERQAFNLDIKDKPGQQTDDSIDDRIQQRMEKLKNADR